MGAEGGGDMAATGVMAAWEGALEVMGGWGVKVAWGAVREGVAKLGPRAN